MQRVLIIGGGFGGLAATRALAGAPVQITLIDKANHHLFQPLLYQVATAGLSAGDIAAPLRHILRGQGNVDVRMGEVIDIDVAARRVLLAGHEGGAGEDLPYDHLIVATGATHAYFGHPEWAAHAPGLKSLDDAMTLRRRILLAFERAEEAASQPQGQAARDAWLTFAVVGAGPTGVELAGTLAEIARHTLRGEFRHINPAKARVQLIEAGPRVLSTFPEALSAKARHHLEALGVEVLTGKAVEHIDDQGYVREGQRVATHTVIWAAGVAASPLGRILHEKTGVALDRAGRVQVTPDLSLPGHPQISVIGDLAALSDAQWARAHPGAAPRPVPGIAPAAKQMGRFVAARIAALSRGQTPPTQAFAYQDSGNLATIGRMAAVVDMAGLRLSGLLAWWIWLAAHVFFLIGFRNRLVVLVNWAWAYWTYQRHARVMFGQEAGHATPAPGARTSPDPIRSGSGS